MTTLGKTQTDIKAIITKKKGDGLIYILNHDNGSYYPIFFSEEQNKLLFDLIMTFDKIISDYGKGVFLLSEKTIDKAIELAYLKGLGGKDE